MRKPLAAIMMLVLLLSGTVPGTQPASALTGSAYAPPPPAPPAPTLPPAGLGIAMQPMPTPPSLGNLPPQVEETRARQAIEAVLEKYLRYWGPRYQVAPVEVEVEGEWAYGVARWQSEAKVLSGPLHVLAHRLADGTWQAVMPESDGLYLRWLDAVPESLVPAGEKSQLRAQALNVLRQLQVTPVVPPAVTIPSLESEDSEKWLEDPGELAPRLLHPTPVSSYEDAQMLEFVYVRDGNVWLTEAEGQSHRQLTFGGHDSDPVLSPRGRVVAYLSVRPQYVGSAPTPQDVCIVDTFTQASTCLTDEPTLRGRPTWSPDGAWLAYVEDGQLVVTDKDGSDRRNVATNVAIDGLSFATPVWSPDGETLACVLDEDGKPAIWLVHISAGPDHMLMSLEQHADTPLAFSPDGDSVAFVNVYDEGRLWMVLLDGTEPVRVAGTQTFVYSFSWSPSADRIAYSRTDGSVWILTLRSGTSREVVDMRTPQEPPPTVEWISGEDILLTVPSSSGSSLAVLSLHDNRELQLTPAPLNRQPVPQVTLSPLGDISAPFEWYRYQGEWDSGSCASDNCGPTSVAAAIQFAHNNQWVSISDIRAYISGGNCGWTNLDQLRGALSHWGVDHTPVTGMDAVRDAVNSRGHIVIVPVWMSYIPTGSDYLSPRSDPANHYSRYYSYTSGHILVVKGFSSDNAWVIVYDPNVWDGNGIYWYSDSTAKGRNRYYSYSSFASAFANNGNKAIEILEVPGSSCSAPSLNSPNDGYVHTSSDRTITFNWSPPSSCTPDGYTFRVKTVPDMDSGGDTVFDEGQGGTQVTKQFASQWDNRDLYWSIRACKPCTPFNPGPWAPSRRFRIEPYTPSCDPNADQIALFVDTDYRGQCVVKDIGEYPNPGSIGLPNDSISSLKVGSNVRAVLCRDDNFVSTCETFNSDDPNLGDNSIGDNQVSSVKVEPRCSPNADQIALFVDPNYKGQCVVKGIDNYPNPSSIGLPNDSISSLKVGGDVRAILCRDDNYQGGCETFTSDDPDLGNNSIGNDQVSSIKVERPIQPPVPPSPQSPANGAWFDEGQEIILCWSATGNEYYGEVWGGPGGTLTFGWQSGTCKNIGAQWAGYTYYWHVRARNGAGESGWSSTRTFTVRLATPSNLSAQAVSCHQVNLYWTDNSSNEEGYRIYRNGTQVGQTGMNVTNYLDTNLSENTSYSYYVKAFHESIESTPSVVVTVQTPPCIVKPDLHPYAPPGYSYPVVPSSVPGTHGVDTLHAGQPTYFDWHFVNSGNLIVSNDYYVDLWIDDTHPVRYSDFTCCVGCQGGYDDIMITVATPGWHTVRLITDPDNTVDESDENNNVWESVFYWTPRAPYADDMEHGANDWGVTGLWHQVGPGNPYPESHSGSRSWWYGQDSTGNYDTGAANFGDLTSPPIYIPSAGYYLRFWYRYETETQGQGYDQRWVQISVDGGPFNNVLQLWDDPMNRWLHSPAINLSGYAGHTIRARFHFDTIDDAFNDYRGWYIDDLDISNTPPPTCADSHEPNNAPAQATPIAYGQTLSADICPGGDYDFYRFTGTASDKVVVDIDAKVNGSSLDSYVFLLDSDGTSVLAEHDDEILVERQDSHLGYQLPHDGTYYVKVRAWNHPSAGGTDHFYTIRLLADNASPSAQITSPGHDTWLNPTQQTIATAISDTGSGIRNVTFYWHNANWDGSSDWIVLDDDWDPVDGWTYPLDTSGIPEQSPDCVVFIYAYDWAGNYAGYGSYHLGIDRTIPTVSAEVEQMYGDAPFRDFWVNWWNGWDNLSGIASYDVQYRDGTSGAWTDLLTNTEETYTRFVGFDDHTYYFRARARDHAGNQSAYASGNGNVQHTVEICHTPPDAYEVDDTRANARWIIPDAPMQARTFYAQGDRDWVRFYAAAGITYTLMTTNTGGHADTVLYLYDRDGTTLVTSNDDDPDRWPASKIVWRPATGGFYSAKVEHWDPWAYGCTTGYGLSIAGSRRTPFSQVYLPLTVRNFDPSHPPTAAVRTLNFRVGFYGRDNATGKPQNIPIKITIEDLSLNQVLFESGWVSVTPASGSNNWGTASVDVSRAGLVAGRSYQVFVRGAMHLTRRVAMPLTDGMTVNYTDLNLNPDGVLWTCDVNQDNQLNGTDMRIVLSHYMATVPTNPDASSELYRSDQNGDGMVNGIDVTICTRSYGKVGDPY